MAELAHPAPREFPGGRLAVAAGTAALAVLAGYMVANASPSSVAVGAAGCVTAAVVIWRPALGALLTIVVLATVPGTTLAAWDIRILGGGIQLTDALLGLTMGAWLLQSAIRPREVRMPPTWVTVSILALLVIALGSLWTAHQQLTPIKSGLTELRPLLGFLLVFPLLSAARSARAVEVGLAVVLTAAAIAAIEIIVRYVLGLGGVATFTGGALRVEGLTFLYPLLALIWAFVLLAYPASTRTRVLLVALAVVSSAALLVTFQRGAWLAVLLVLPFMVLLLRPGRRTRVIVVAAPLITAAVLLFLTFNTFSVAQSTDPLQATADRLLSLSQATQDASTGHRLAEWERSFEEIRDAPLTGVGLGSSITFFSPLYSPATNRNGSFVSSVYIHSSYVWAPLKMGIPGALVLLFIVIALARSAFLAYRKARSPRTERLAVGALATLTALALTAVGGPHLHTAESVSYLAALIVGVEVIRRLGRLAPRAEAG
jgi:O-antigen ligase